MLVGSRRVLGFVAAASIAALPFVSQPLPAAASSAGTLYAVFGESQVVSIDPATGAMTMIADLTTPSPGSALGDLVSDAGTHRLFAPQTTWSFDPDADPQLTQSYQLVTVDTQSHAVAISPDLAQPVSLAFDSSTNTLFGLTACCPVQVVRLDPATGTETAVATLAGTQFSSMAIATATHTMYVASTIFGTFPPTSVLFSVNTVTGAVSSGPNLSTGALLLAYDNSAGTLFGKTFCCPTHVLNINPQSGNEAIVGSFDLGYGNSLAVDPSSHTLFAMEDVLSAFSFDQYVAAISDQTGAISLSTAIPLTGYIRSLAFESVLSAVDKIKADVQAAIAGGAIAAGVGNSFLAELNAAQSARSRGQCDVATNLYQALIDELNAQSGKQVAPATASQLISEAQFLIATCP